jgi:CheY-like chemotaxis protein
MVLGQPDVAATTELYFTFPTENPAMSHSKRILVIDDEPALIRGISVRLRSTGYEVLGAPTAEVGLAAVQRQTPDAVLLDAQLPDMSGLELLALLQGDENTANIPVVMMSGSDRDARRAAQLGARRFLVKPFERQELTDCLQACWSGTP